MADLIAGGSPAEISARRVRFEEALVDCMEAAGFDYWVEAEPGTPAPTSAYGVADRVRHQVAGEGSPSAVSRNDTYFASLSPDAQARYELALEGSPDDPALQGGPGCEEQAGRSAFGDNPLETPEGQQRLDHLLEQIAADPEIAQATYDWSTCMSSANADYAFADQNALLAFLNERAEKVLASTNVGGQVVKGDAIADLTQLENDLFAADERCAKSTGLTEVQNRVARAVLGD